MKIIKVSARTKYKKDPNDPKSDVIEGFRECLLNLATASSILPSPEGHCIVMTPHGPVEVEESLEQICEKAGI